MNDRTGRGTVMTVREVVWRSVAVLTLVLSIVTGPASIAQTTGGNELQKPRKCDYDINADCRTRDDKPRRQDREGAPVDLTGYWVSVVTEDWRWRMMTPPKGDIASIPLRAEGELATLAWDPDKDGDNCKSFGAPGLLRNPMRLRVQWQGDDTLRLETDHGMQTRLFHFGNQAAAAGPPTLQGDSTANWQESGLRVVTTNLSPGYLRKNGVPYSAATVLTEYYDRISAFGDDWLIVTSVVNDPAYLSREFITSTHFKELPDGSSWKPLPCETG